MLVRVDAARPRPLVSLPGPGYLRELWEWRVLFASFLRRDLSTRYGRNGVGLLWVIAQPLSAVLVLGLIFGRITRIMPDAGSYRIFILTGITLWTFLRGAVTAGAGSLSSQRQLITRVYFPRTLLPLAAVAGRVCDLALGIAVVLVVLAASGMWPPAGAWAIVPVLAVTLVLVTGLALASAALNVRFRALGSTLPAVLQLWMLLSPVIYPASMVPTRWRGGYALNPATGILEAFRAALLGHAVDWGALGVSAAGSVALLVVGFSVFRRMEDSFADSL